MNPEQALGVLSLIGDLVNRNQQQGREIDHLVEKLAEQAMPEEADADS